MSNTNVHQNEIAGIIDAQVADLETFLNGLTETQLSEQFDDRGWNILDHFSHFVGWEEALLMCYFGKQVHETLGIPIEQFSDKNMDWVNEAIREKWSGYSFPQLLEKWHSFHGQVMERISLLSTEDFERPVLEYLPSAPAGYGDTNVMKFMKDYTFGHYPEHLEYMKKIASSRIDG